MSTERKTREIEASVDQLVAALDIAGVDKRTTLVLGGSALAFAGIRPAHDLDIMVTGQAFSEMEKTSKTPGGLIVRRKPEAKQRPFLDIYPSAGKPFILPTDITFPHNENFLPTPELDQVFVETIRDFDTVANYHYLPPRMVLEHKQGMDRLRHKDRRDVRLIGAFLSRQHHR
ncbi:MAG TPA: hypothetical protein VFH06_05440 [Candidatus Saccharimonadales bacterium]|nr:hypothetical protein [Candidatus Saccharimonadales bacterium]